MFYIRLNDPILSGFSFFLRLLLKLKLTGHSIEAQMAYTDQLGKS